MGKRKRIEAINGETQLPGDIIPIIQSFLSEKEAARSTILSKSWYEAWLTRPNLVFSEADNPKTLRRYGKKTLRRFERLNLKIQSFKVLIDGCSSKENLSDRISLASKWTRKALKLGATDIDIQISHVRWKDNFVFVLPQDVLDSQTLAKLSLSVTCKIDPQYRKVSSTLKSLSLCKVKNIWDILVMFPLIEELVLSNCSYRYTSKYNKDLVLRPGLHMKVFHNLKVLSLKKVKFGEIFFQNFSSRFPCLEDLGLHLCTGHKEIRIRSNSLERISITDLTSHIMLFEFDVPRIKKFTLSSSFVPSVSFKTNSTEWESDISIGFALETTPLTRVREFLRGLSPSKIDLQLHVGCMWHEYRHAGDLVELRKPPIVEKLTIQMSTQFGVQFTFLRDLFWICRPNFLVLHFWPCSISVPKYANSSDLVKLLCKIPIEEGSGNGNMSDLEEAKFDFFRYDGFGGWLPLSCESLIEASALSEERRVRACLQLKWRKSV